MNYFQEVSNALYIESGYIEKVTILNRVIEDLEKKIKLTAWIFVVLMTILLAIIVFLNDFTLYSIFSCASIYTYAKLSEISTTKKIYTDIKNGLVLVNSYYSEDLYNDK